MLGVDVTNQPIDIVNKGRTKEGPTCPKYVQANSGCGPSSPVLSSASGVDTKWIFTPTGNRNGRFQFYISMSVSAAATSRQAAEMSAIVLKMSVPLTTGSKGKQLPHQPHRRVYRQLQVQFY